MLKVVTEEQVPVTEATRFETRPTAAPATSTTLRSVATFNILDNFEGFTFPAPIRAPATTESTPVQSEVPRSQFNLQQSFVPAQPLQQPQQPATAAPVVQPAFQFAQPQQQPAPVQQPQQPQRFTPFVAFNNQQFQNVNRFQPPTATQAPVQAQVPATQASVPALNPQFQSFNLLNQANFQAFDAQFGGSVTGNTQSNPSNIFAQPQTSLPQGRDVLVNPFSNNQQQFPAQQNLFQQQQQQPA